MSPARRPGKGGGARILRAAEFDEALAAAESAAPLYVLGGAAFLRDEATAAVRRLAGLEGEAGRMNLEVVGASEAAPEEVLGRLSTLPFLAPARMAVVRGADSWLAATRRAPLEAFAEAAPPQAVLVLQLEKKVDEKNPVVAAAARRGGAAMFWPPRDEREAGRWLVARARARGLRISPEGVAALLEAVGADLASLAAEVEKLRMLHAAAAVGPAEVAAAVGSYRESDLDDFGDALTRRDLSAALTAVDRSPAVRREAVLWAASSARRIRNLRRALPLCAAGASAETLQEKLGIWKKEAVVVAAAARRHKRAGLERGVLDLLALDRGLKGGAPAAHLARFDLFVARFMTPAPYNSDK